MAFLWRHGGRAHASRALFRGSQLDRHKLADLWRESIRGWSRFDEEFLRTGSPDLGKRSNGSKHRSLFAHTIQRPQQLEWIRTFPQLSPIWLFVRLSRRFPPGLLELRFRMGFRIRLVAWLGIWLAVARLGLGAVMD